MIFYGIGFDFFLIFSRYHKYYYDYENFCHTSACIKARNHSNHTQKSIPFYQVFEQHRMQSEVNTLTYAGIYHQINHSIQAEGAFSKLKDGLGYARFPYRSMKNVALDIFLIALGINLNKLHSKILNHQTEIIAYKKIAKSRCTH